MTERRKEQPEIERWVTVTDAAVTSGVSARTIRRYIREGVVQAVKRGRLYLVNLRSLGHTKKPYHRRCLYCGRPFRASRRHQRFCCARCRIVYHNREYRKRQREKRDQPGR